MADSINCIIVVWDGNGELKAEDGVFLRYSNCVNEFFRGNHNRYEICHSRPCGDCNLMPSGIRPHAMLGIVYHAWCLSIKNFVVGQYQNTMKPQRRRKLPVKITFDATLGHIFVSSEICRS